MSSQDEQIQDTGQGELQNLTERRALLLLLLTCGLIFFPRLGGRDLWNPDEPRFALIAREMLRSGDYLVPRRNGNIYLKKPPMLFWAMAFFGKLCDGMNETAARFPSALAATGMVLLTFYFGRAHLGLRAGFASALVCATNYLVYWQGRFAQTDMLFSFFVVAAIFAVCHAYMKPKLAWPLAIAGYTAAGLAALTKGPLALVLLFLAIVPFAAHRQFRRKEFPSVRVLLPHVAGVILCLAIALPWYSKTSQQIGTNVASRNLVRENLVRFFKGFDHVNPVFHYLLMLPVEFFPWSLFLPAGLILLWQKRKSEGDNDWVARFLLFWLGMGFLFFSASASKQGKYLLPLYPGFALGVGWLLEERLFRKKPGSPGLYLPFLLTNLLLIVAAVTGTVVFKKGYESYSDLLPIFLPAVGFFFIGGLSGTIFLVRKKAVHFSSLAVTMLVGCLALSISFPSVNKYKSARPLCETYRAQADREDRLVYYGAGTPDSYAYYARRDTAEIHKEKELVEFISLPGRVFMFTRQDAYKRLSPSAREQWDLIDERQVGSNFMLLLRSKE